MPGLYTVTIRPVLLTVGEYRGHLEYLHFTATAGDHAEKWWAVNTGTLSEDFRGIFGEWGATILERLRNELAKAFLVICYQNFGHSPACSRVS